MAGTVTLAPPSDAATTKDCGWSTGCAHVTRTLASAWTRARTSPGTRSEGSPGSSVDGPSVGVPPSVGLPSVGVPSVGPPSVGEPSPGPVVPSLGSSVEPLLGSSVEPLLGSSPGSLASSVGPPGGRGAVAPLSGVRSAGEVGRCEGRPSAPVVRSSESRCVGRSSAALPGPGAGGTGPCCPPPTPTPPGRCGAGRVASWTGTSAAEMSTVDVVPSAWTMTIRPSDGVRTMRRPSSTTSSGSPPPGTMMSSAARAPVRSRTTTRPSPGHGT